MKLFKKRLWEGLALGMTSVFVVVSGAYSIAMSQSAAINNALNISTSSIERSSDPQYQYFKSDYGADEYDKLQSDYLALGEEVESEGIVLLKNDNDALPLSSGEKVSTFLTGSVMFNYSASGSGSFGFSSRSLFSARLFPKFRINPACSKHSGGKMCEMPLHAA